MELSIDTSAPKLFVTRKHFGAEARFTVTSIREEGMGFTNANATRPVRMARLQIPLKPGRAATFERARGREQKEGKQTERGSARVTMRNGRVSRARPPREAGVEKIRTSEHDGSAAANRARAWMSVLLPGHCLSLMILFLW